MQEVLGLCAVPFGAEADEPLQTRKSKTRQNTVRLLNRRLFFPESVTPALRWCVNSARIRKPAWRRRPSSRYSRERQGRRCLSVSGTELHRRQKGRLCSNKQHGRICRQTQCPGCEKRRGPTALSTAMESDVDFDANHTWKPRERVMKWKTIFTRKK